MATPTFLYNRWRLGYKYRRGGCLEDFYYFDPAKASNLTLDAPFTGELTLLFSTFQDTQGLPPEFANETVTNAPIGAKDDSSLYDGTGNQITKTVTNLTQVIAANFDGVLWGYALDGVWYYVNQGAPATRFAPNFNGLSQYGFFAQAEVYSGDFWIEITAELPNTTPSGNRALFGGSGGGGTSPSSFVLYIDGAAQAITAQIATTSGGRYDISVPIASHLSGKHIIRLSRVSGVWSMLIDNVIVDTYDSTAHGVINQSVRNIGRWSTALYYEGMIYNYKDSHGNHYPLDDGFDNNPVMRNAGSGQDGTFVNMTAAAWVEVLA